MATTSRDIRETLLSCDAEFRRLAAEHSRYEAQLEQIRKQTYLNSEDLCQEVELKKLKLRVKDLMEQLVIRFMSEPTYH
ncbi:MAG: hypothetical protein WCC76_13785 [Candidatus Acidiferrales bacterium]|jgi:uncharacterized protein YdcH (DUF465 family)